MHHLTSTASLKLTKILVLGLSILFIASCREKDKGPRMADALLYGHYFNTNAFNDLRLFAMRLHTDGTFTWYDANSTLSGEWSQTEKKVEFNFTSGAMNRWGGTIDGDEIRNITGPNPSNFQFAYIGIAKNSIPPKLKGTDWRELYRSGHLRIAPSQAEGKYNIIHGHLRNVGSEGLIYDQVDRQVLMPSKTLNNGNHITMILLNGENLVVYRYEPIPYTGEKNHETYAYVIK